METVGDSLTKCWTMQESSEDVNIFEIEIDERIEQVRGGEFPWMQPRIERGAFPLFDISTGPS